MATLDDFAKWWNDTGQANEAAESAKRNVKRWLETNHAPPAQQVAPDSPPASPEAAEVEAEVETAPRRRR